MRTLTSIFDGLLKLAGLGAVILGITFWTGNALQLVPLHMVLGLLTVLSLVVLATLGARAGLRWDQTGLRIAWSVLMIGVGIGQTRLLSGESHWIIQVLHLALGVTTVWLGAQTARQLKSGHPARKISRA